MQGRPLVTRWVNVQSPNNPTDRREVFVGIQPYGTHQCLDSGCESSATGILLSRVRDDVFRQTRFSSDLFKIPVRSVLRDDSLRCA